MSSKVAFCRLALLLAALVFFVAPVALAHFIPRDVTVLSFVKPEGQTLKMLIRVPVKGIEDVEVPRREQEYVDLTRIDQALRDTAQVFLIDNLKVYEGDTQLAPPRIVATRPERRICERITVRNLGGRFCASAISASWTGPSP